MRVMMPSSLGEACRMMAAESGAAPIAGATDVMVHWPVNIDAKAKTYLDLSGVGELRGIRWTSESLVLGALSTYWDAIGDARIAGEFGILAAAARQVGAIQIQSRGTWAGNIANGSPAADGVPALMACDATVVLRDERGEERVRLDEFYLGYKKMRKRPEQIITAIEMPRRAVEFWAFEKVGPRRAQAITKVGAAIVQSAAGWRVVVNSVAPTVRRLRGLESALGQGRAISGPAEIEALAAGDISPIDDIRSTAEYRRAVLARVIYHAVRGRAGVT